MRCPICGGSELAPDIQGMPYSYKGEMTVIPEVSGDYCSACGECVLSHDEAMRVSHLMTAFERQVNANVVDPSFIASIRRKFDLDQREAGKSSVVGSMRSPVMKTARPPRQWRW